ncbi:MAG: hypothetical protein U1F63_08530 [Chitinivorax sp.]
MAKASRHISRKAEKKSRVINRMAWVALLLALLGTLLLSLGQYRSSRISGPRLAATDQVGQIYIVSDRTAYVFDDGGVRRETVALSKFGIHGDVSDFLPMPGGDWLLADAETAQIKRCNPKGGECLLLSDRIAASIGKLKPPIRLTLDEASHRLFIADGGNHRLVALRLNGDVLDTSNPGADPFKAPAQIRVDGERLLVADSRNRRLAEVALLGDRFGAVRTFAYAETPLARSGHVYPNGFLHRANGSYVLINADGSGHHGDLIEYGAAGEPLRMLPDYGAPSSSHLTLAGLLGLLDNYLLGWEADPQSLVETEERLVVADPSLMQVNQQSIGGEWQQFGDPVFLADLHELSAAKRGWMRWRQFGGLTLFAALLLGMVAMARGLWIERSAVDVPTRLVTRFAAPTMVLQNGVHWIEANGSTRRFAAQVLASVTVLSLLFGAGVILSLIWGNDADAHADWWPLWLPLATAAGAAACLLLLRRFARYRIGTDGHVLYLMEPNGIQRSIALTNVRYTPHRIWVGSRWMTYRTPIGELFRRQELRRYVFSLLPASARMNEWEAAQEVLQLALAHHPWLRWALPLSSVLLIGVLFAR